MDQTECILWDGAITPKGYGTTPVSGKTVYIHRLTYTDTYGSIPPGMVVRHKCDTPACYNPEHLELGSYQDNSQDMVDRDRSTRGERNRHAKLTAELVLELRELHSSGNYLQRELAEQYGVTIATVNDIVKRRSWRHV